MQPKVWIVIAFGLCVLGPVHAATGETAKADSTRKKPLQRCDQLSGKAELDCLQKARERIVEARQQRQAAEKKGAGNKAAPEPEAAQKAK